MKRGRMKDVQSQTARANVRRGRVMSARGRGRESKAFRFT
jgi:hypothetical protein